MAEQKVKKLTKREKYEMLANLEEVKNNPILAQFVADELVLLAKKNASNSDNPTKLQIENNGIKEEILACMAKEPNKLFTITDMIKNFPCCKDLANQRVSALVRQLKEEQKVIRVEEKRKAYFKIA